MEIEDEEEEDDDDEEEKPIRKKNSISKRSIQASTKKPIQPAECDAIAIIYSIESEKHPFHHLDGKYASVELDKVFDFDKTEVIFLKF